MDKETYEKWKSNQDYLKIYFEYYKEKVKDEKYKLQDKCENLNDFQSSFIFWILANGNSNLPLYKHIIDYYDKMFKIIN
jgi:hypothetical protein